MTPHLSTMMPSGHQSRNLGVGKVSRSALSRWLYCTVLYCTVLYCTVLYCTVLYLSRWLYCPRNSEPGPKRHSWLFM